MGDALPVGQTGMQMFNFSRYINGTAAEQKAKVENLGDAALNITNVTIGNTAGGQGSARDFTITSQTCTGGPLAAASGTNPASSCTVFVRFNPRRALTTSIATLQFTSNSDAATNRIPLVATSGPSVSAPIAVGGDVASQLTLDVTGPSSLGAFVPGTARDYTASLVSEVTTTTPDAALSAVDAGRDRGGSPRQRHPGAATGPEGPRRQRGQPLARVHGAPGDRGSAVAAHLRRSGHQGAGHDRLPAVDRRVRDAPAWHVRQDADVHADVHHAVT
jgi:hypothetical protein